MICVIIAVLLSPLLPDTPTQGPQNGSALYGATTVISMGGSRSDLYERLAVICMGGWQ